MAAAGHDRYAALALVGLLMAAQLALMYCGQQGDSKPDVLAAGGVSLALTALLVRGRDLSADDSANLEQSVVDRTPPAPHARPRVPH